uniref:(northern house mosquito) hypothetical protein n=1 Tax=Culex pipiens TaxID=7175 RepID=A0A8D8IBX4_CULPI
MYIFIVVLLCVCLFVKFSHFYRIQNRLSDFFSIFGTVLRCSIFISFFRNIFCFIFEIFSVQNSVFTQPRMYFKATTISMFDGNEDRNFTKIFALEVISLHRKIVQKYDKVIHVFVLKMFEFSNLIENVPH